MPYETVFLISLRLKPVLLVAMAVPPIFLTYTIIVRVLYKKGIVSNAIRILFGRLPISICGLLTVVSFFMFFVYLSSTIELVSAYRDGRYELTEGNVHVIHKQPEYGHDKGDVILIDGVEFEVDYFGLTKAYSQTIAHGGVLKEGAYVRIYHSDGQILRIDIRSDQQPRKN